MKRAFFFRYRWIGAVCVGVGGVLSLGAVFAMRPDTLVITSYEACVEAGNPISLSYPPVCRAGGQSFVGLVSSPSPTPEPITRVPFEILVDGDTGGDEPRSQKVITSQAEWETYWRRVHGGLASLPPLILVNFATSQVLALSHGPQVTSGYGYKVTGITASSSGTQVAITESIPTVTCAVAEVRSNRYYLVRTPRLAPPVSFVTTTEHRKC